MLEDDWKEAREQGDTTMWVADWSGRELEWRDICARVERLSRQYQNGEMSPKQTERYLELVAALHMSVPILRRLKWWIPLVAVDIPPSDRGDESIFS